MPTFPDPRSSSPAPTTVMVPSVRSRSARLPSFPSAPPWGTRSPTQRAFDSLACPSALTGLFRAWQSCNKKWRFTMSNADHEKFMRRAIELSALAALEYDTGGPFGAVIVKDNKIVAEGMNRVLASHDPTWHGEME